MRFLIVIFILAFVVSLFLIKVDSSGDRGITDILELGEASSTQTPAGLYTANAVQWVSKEKYIGCPISVNGHSVLLKPLAGNDNILEKNITNRWPIASITKLMTSVIAVEKIGVDVETTISENAVATEGISGNFTAGEIFKVGDLIKAMLLVSSNDAAVAVAEAFDKSAECIKNKSASYATSCYTKFIDEMQKKAAELKMTQTTFFEPTGLSYVNQSTASDLSKLVNYIYQNHPELFDITRQKKLKIIELKSGKSRMLINTNRFVGTSKFLGGKTGYIDESGHNLITLFNVQGKIILSIVLGSDNAFDETKELLKCL